MYLINLCFVFCADCLSDWIGPLLGGLIAAGYFGFVKFFNYEEANPGQDSAGRDFISN